MDIYYIDGAFFPADAAVLPVNDLAVLRGYGVFDLMRTYNGAPLYMEDHIERLAHSASEIGLSFPWKTAAVADIVRQTLDKNRHLADASIRMIVTGGPSDDFSTPKNAPRLLVLVSAVPSLPAAWYKEGVKIVTVITERFKPGVKSINYIPATIAMETARKANAVEAIYLDRNHRVLEGTTSNIFAFIGGRLVTPGAEILSGITRKVTLEVSRELFPVDIRDILLDELHTADEVFITGTNKGLVPVNQVDEHRIGDGRPGTNTRRLMTKLGERIARHAPSAENGK
ncbi:MAG: aminotransferase class IV [Pseudomonadota bacterium]